MLFVIFSVCGSIFNAYAQQFSGNRQSARVDLVGESLESGQLLSTPEPSANNLGAPAEQTDISSNIKQEGSQEEEEQESNSDEEDNNANESENEEE